MLKLKFVSARNPRLAPLLDGTVKPENIELDIVLSPPGELFYHNLLHDDFDVSEMSMSECLIVRERNEAGKWQWSGLPVFLSKAFLWFNLMVNTASGIERGEDFKGKRVAIPDFPMTAALWMRIMFKELFDVGRKTFTGTWGGEKRRAMAGSWDSTANRCQEFRSNGSPKIKRWMSCSIRVNWMPPSVSCPVRITNHRRLKRSTATVERG